MRLFVAVELGQPLVSALERLLTALRPCIEDVAPASRVAWVAPSRLHVTVRFIGNVADDRVEPIMAVLQRPLNLAPFDVTVAGVGTFPAKGPPRVIWAGLAEGIDPLRRLERAVSARLRDVGIPFEKAAYSPHITLGRVRKPANLLRARWREGVADLRFGTERVREVTLFESRLAAAGPTYVPLQRTTLSVDQGADEPDGLDLDGGRR